MRSVCRQLRLVLQLPVSDGENMLSLSYDEVVQHFHQLLSGTVICCDKSTLTCLRYCNLTECTVRWLDCVYWELVDLIECTVSELP